MNDEEYGKNVVNAVSDLIVSISNNDLEDTKYFVNIINENFQINKTIPLHQILPMVDLLEKTSNNKCAIYALNNLHNLNNKEYLLFYSKTIDLINSKDKNLLRDFIIININQTDQRYKNVLKRLCIVYGFNEFLNYFKEENNNG